jgi:hypothetical protein
MRSDRQRVSTVKNGEHGFGPRDESDEAVLARVSDARNRLAAAAATADSLALSQALDALEEALAAAQNAGVDVPPATK